MSTVPVLDLFQLSAAPDAEVALGRLARRHPVIRTRQAGGHKAWTVLSAALTQQLLADSRLSNELHPLAPHAAQSPDGPTVLFEQDGADHARTRKLVSAAFNSKAVRALEQRMIDIVRRLLDRLDGLDAGEEVDLLAEFAMPYPLEVICELLGVPIDDRPQFERRVANVDSSEPAARKAALAGFLGYCGKLVQAKRAEPADDLLSELVQEGTLTDTELVGLCSVLLFAGHVTTAFTLASTVAELSERPDQWTALRADPSLAAAAAEEGLRYRGALLATTHRIATTDLDVGGVHIPQGGLVRFLLSAANRDPAMRADPDEFDIGRATSGHLAFGHGPHFCVGQRLARQEITVALAELARRYRRLELSEPVDDLEWRSSDSLRGLTGLRVRLTRDDVQ
jgi:cytochrome P450